MFLHLLIHTETVIKDIVHLLTGVWLKKKKKMNTVMAYFVRQQPGLGHSRKTHSCE